MHPGAVAQRRLLGVPLWVGRPSAQTWLLAVSYSSHAQQNGNGGSVHLRLGDAGQSDSAQTP